MDYCTFAQVKKEVKHLIIDANSIPTKAEVKEFITEVSEGIIDPLIRSYVNLPITDVIGLKFLKQIATNGVVEKIYTTLKVDIETITLYQDKFNDGIKAIKDNPNVLVGDTSSNVAIPTSNFNSSYEHKFKKDERQW